MAYTRGRHVLESVPEEPEPTTAQMHAAFLRMAEELRAEREERRAEKLARRAEKDAHRCQGSINSFFKLNPPSFFGTENALASVDWLKDVDNLLTAAHISEEDRVPFVTLLLKGGAHVWWEA